MARLAHRPFRVRTIVVNAVNRAPTVIEVTFGEATPVSEAVGGSVEANAVVGDGPGEDSNLPDEALLTSSTATSSIGGLAFAGFAGFAAMSMLMIRRRRG